MKILITGATGFIGQHLVKALLNEGYAVSCIVRSNSETSNIDPSAIIFKYDENIDKLFEYFEKENFDGVIHLASLFLVEHTKNDIKKIIKSNIEFGTEILEACKVSKVSWFINTGSFWQHYNNEEYNPVNLYAATKQAFEIIARYYMETSNLIFTTIKLSDTFGYKDKRNKIFNLWMKISETGEVLEMSQGEQILDICYVEDVVSAYLRLIELLTSNENKDFKGKVFAVKSERKTLRELAEIFEKTTKKKLNIKWGAKKYREREVMNAWENGVKVPGWEPKYSFEDAILRMFGGKERK